MVRDGTFTVSTISISHTPSHRLTDSPPAGSPRQRDADDAADDEDGAEGARDITDEGGDIDCGRAWVRADGLSKPQKAQSISVMRDIQIKSRQHKRLDPCYFHKVSQKC